MDIDSDRRGKHYKTFKQLEKEHDVFQNYVVRCPCGHSLIFTSKKDRILCNWCGQYVYKDKKAKYKYKMKELLK